MNNTIRDAAEYKDELLGLYRQMPVGAFYTLAKDYLPEEYEANARVVIEQVISERSEELKTFGKTVPCAMCKADVLAADERKLYQQALCGKCRTRFVALRSLAYLVDVMLIFSLAKLAAANSFESSEVSSLIWLTSVTLFLCRDSISGQSLGKVIFGLVVLDEDAKAPAGILKSVMRNLPLFIPLVPLFGFLQLGDGYRFGDGWAKTRVILKKYSDTFGFQM